MTNYNFQKWRSLIDGQEVSAIPDSVVMQYVATNVNGGDTTWTDDTGTSDMSLTGGETDTTVNDSEALNFDGVDDHGLITLPSDLEGSSLQEWSIEFSLAWTHSSDNVITGVIDGSQLFQIRINRKFGTETGQIDFRIDDDTGNELLFAPENNPNLDDGDRHDISFIIDDASNNDVRIEIDGSDVNVDLGSSDGPNDFDDWSFDAAVGGRNNEGSVDLNEEIDLIAQRWHDSAISEQTINDL